MENKKRIFLTVFFVYLALCVGNQIFFYSNESVIVPSTKVTYNHTSTSYSTASDSYQVLLPRTTSHGLYPVVILIHGDETDSRSMNLAKQACLENNFAVVLYDYENSLNLAARLKVLNETLNEISILSQLNMSAISVVGHSRGAFYALYLGILRPDLIRAVVAGNLGFFEDFESDFEMYQTTMPELQYASMGPSSPRNVLIVSDSNDMFSTDTGTYLRNLTANDAAIPDVLYGNFSGGSARKLIIRSTVYGHSASIQSGEILYREIEWISNSINATVPLDTTNMLEVRSSIALTWQYLLLIFGFLFWLSFSSVLSYQGAFLKLVRQKLGKIIGRRTRGKETPAVPPPESLIPSLGQAQILDQKSSPIPVTTLRLKNKFLEAGKDSGVFPWKDYKRILSIFVLFGIILCIIDYLSYIFDYSDIIQTPYLILNQFLRWHGGTTLVNDYVPFPFALLWTIFLPLLILYYLLRSNNPLVPKMKTFSVARWSRDILQGCELAVILFFVLVFNGINLGVYIINRYWEIVGAGVVGNYIIFICLNFILYKISPAKMRAGKQGILLGMFSTLFAYALLFLVPWLDSIYLSSIVFESWIETCIWDGLILIAIAMVNPFLYRLTRNISALSVFNALLFCFLIPVGS